MRGTKNWHLKTTLMLSTLCIAACATSNYAPVVYHDNTNATGGAPVVSMGDPARDVPPRRAPGTVAPVQSEALGATVESVSLPAPGSSGSYVEAEQPHSMAPPDARYAVTTAEQQRVASAAPMQLETRPVYVA